MKFCFTLDDVLRAKSQQILKMYKKYEDNSFDIDAVDLSTNDFQAVLGFDDRQDYFRFLYEDYPFEIFAEASTTEKMVDKELNLWMLRCNEYYEDIDYMIANPFEFNASIGNTHFFLSKIAPRIRETYFPTNSATIWDRCDVLITAEPKLIESKPEGKIVIKIKMPYNEHCESDYEFDTLMNFLKDNKVMDSIYGFEPLNDVELEDVEIANNVFADAEEIEIEDLNKE